jgi:hypothetical protein
MFNGDVIIPFESLRCQVYDNNSHIHFSFQLSDREKHSN